MPHAWIRYLGTLLRSGDLCPCRRGGAGAAEDLKRREYLGLESYFICLPFTVDTLDTWSQEGLGFINEILTRLSEATVDSSAGSYFVQR